MNPRAHAGLCYTIHIERRVNHEKALVSSTGTANGRGPPRPARNASAPFLAGFFGSEGGGTHTNTFTGRCSSSARAVVYRIHRRTTAFVCGKKENARRRPRGLGRKGRGGASSDRLLSPRSTAETTLPPLRSLYGPVGRPAPFFSNAFCPGLGPQGNHLVSTSLRTNRAFASFGRSAVHRGRRASACVCAK